MGNGWWCWCVGLMAAKRQPYHCHRLCQRKKDHNIMFFGSFLCFGHCRAYCVGPACLSVLRNQKLQGTYCESQ